jgi:PPM family protein phosphatase
MASLKVTYGQITDKGLNPKRLENEDNLLVMPKRGLFLVADGVGGRVGGRVASQTVVDVFNRVFTQEQPEDLRDLVISTVDLCNHKIFEEAQTNPDLTGMATTIALLVVEGRRAVIAHVGDSRVYRYDDQGLICLTADHSEVNEAIRAGEMTPEQAARHPRRNVINRALGAEADVEPDIVEIEVDQKTSFLICSDGITRHVTDEEIARLLRSDRRPEIICETLKELCYKGGAEDNLTAVVVNLGERNYVEEPTRPAQAARAKAAPAISVAVPRSNTPQGSQKEGQKGRKIEVDLQSPGDKSAADPPLRSILRSKPQAALGAAIGYQSSSVSPELAGVSGEDTGQPKKGELSTGMKLTLIIISLLAGLVIGIMFGQPIRVRLDDIIYGHRAAFDKAGEKNMPADAEVTAAYARFLEGYSQEARERLNQVLINNPNNAEAHFYLGRIDYGETKYDEAINHFSQALRLDPNIPDLRVHLAMAYLSIGQQRNARDILQQAVGPSPEPSTSPPTPAQTASPGRAKPVG